MEYFEIRWTISRGRDTEGFNICSIWQNGKKITSCKGGNYDMKGTCFGNWLEIKYADRLKRLYAPSFYGLTFLKKKKGKNGGYAFLKWYRPNCIISLDGAYGWESMKKIAKAIKLNIRQTHVSTNLRVYLVEDKKRRSPQV